MTNNDMKRWIDISWLDTTEPHDYPAAASYLSLLFPSSQVQRYITALKKADIEFFKAKDIFRASHLSLLGVSNSHVQKDQEKMRAQIPLSPLLLVRDPKVSWLLIADGYHRLCAVYAYDEDALIPCKIVD